MFGRTSAVPRRPVAWVVAALLVVSLSSVLGIATHGRDPGAAAQSSLRHAARAAATPSRPNILLVVADDQTYSTFNPSLMPNVYGQLVDQGVFFKQAYVNTSLCCPSRSQMYTGLYGTDTNVSSNFDELTRPTLIQAMHDSGYRTLLAGKYLNSTPCEDVKPEFDDYYCYGDGDSSEKDPTINVNGTGTPFTGYSADILASFVTHFIATTPSDQPFLAVYTPKDPHEPANDDRFDDLPVPVYRPPNFDEDTLDDGKPQAVQRGPLTDREIAQIDSQYQDMYRSSRGLDDAVGTILGSLGSRASNTVVIYISDNGFFYGEHRRVEGKIDPYQESVNVPMIIRDPALHSTSDPEVSNALVENVDIAATIAERAGIEWHTDGTSLVPLLDGSQSTVRDGALIEHCIAGAGAACWPPGSNEGEVFVGVVTDQYKYVEYDTGEKELYDLVADPYELVNHAGDPSWAATQANLASQLASLRAVPPPDTTIVAGPQGVVAPGSQTFTYFTPSISATYQCRLSSADDPGSWAPCDPQGDSVGPLDSGSYTFAVAGAVNGDIDSTPAERSFTVDASLPVISVADASVNEGASGAARRLSFSVSLSHPSSQPVTVSYRTDDGTAAAGSDYTAKWGTVTIPAKHTTRAVFVPVTADRRHEADETLQLRLRNPVGGVLGVASATGTIIDDDPLPTVSVGKASATEGTGTGGVISVPIRLSAASGEAVLMHADTQPATAHLGDYTSTHQEVTITPGETVAYVNVPVVGDAVNEANEHFTMALSNAVGATIGTASAQETIVDDDPVPSVSIDDSSAIEGDNGDLTPMTFPVTLSAPSGRTVTVTYNTFDDTAVAPGDYLAKVGTLTFKPGVVSQSITIDVVGDNLIEGDEQFEVDLSVTPALVIGRGEAVGVIQDNESPPLISVADTSVTEGDTGTVPAPFSVSLSVPSTHTVTVDYATADGTATAPDDYLATNGTVTFAPGQMTATVDVPVVGDTLRESDETFTLNLSNPTNATLGTDTGTGTILDDDSRPELSVANSPDVTEGDTDTTEADFTVSIDAITNRDVSIDYTTVDGTATAPGDYLATAGTATIPAGATNTIVAVPVVGDTAYEANEEFSLVLSNPVNATLGNDTATATIIDDDAPPTVTLVSNVVVNEGDSGTTDAVFTAALSAASGLPTTVDYQTSDVTAVAPDDYLATSGSVTIAPGDTSATFSVPVVGDTLYEGEERFLVTLTGAINGAVSDDDFGAYGIITDDDPAPVVSLAGDVNVAEGDSGLTDAVFTVSQSAVSGASTTVDFQTSDDTAVAPDDYLASAGTVTIAPGDTNATFSVPVVGDTLYEGDERFVVTLSNPANSTISDTGGVAYGNIIDDDPPPGDGLISQALAPFGAR